MCRFYFADMIHVLHENEKLHAARNAKLADSTAIIFHRVMSRVLYRWTKLPQPDADGKKGRMAVHDEIASQYDVVRLLREEGLYNFSVCNTTERRRLIERQQRLGRIAATNLALIEQDTVLRTGYAPLVDRLQSEFHPFTPQHCHLEN